MNATIVSCGKCGGQVPLKPDEDGVCPCIQCGARHDANGKPLVSEDERERIQKMVRRNGNGNGHHESSDESPYNVKHLHRRLDDGGLVYGQGCSKHPDCFTCPEKEDCVATYRCGNATSKKPYFVLTHNKSYA